MSTPPAPTYTLSIAKDWLVIKVDEDGKVMHASAYVEELDTRVDVTEETRRVLRDVIRGAQLRRQIDEKLNNEKWRIKTEGLCG